MPGKSTSSPDGASTGRARPPGPRLPAPVQTLLFVRCRDRWFPRLRRAYGDVFALDLAAPVRHRVVILARREHVDEVFGGPTDVLHAGKGNAVLRPVMGGRSVLLTDGDEHRRVRRLLLPALSVPALRAYEETMRAVAAAEVERWPVGEVFPAHRRMRELTLEVISRVVLGVTSQARLAELRPLTRRLTDMGQLTLLGLSHPHLARLRPWRRLLAVRRRLDALIDAQVAERRAALEEGDDVLSHLLRAAAAPHGDGFDGAELRDQLVTLLLAGHETTATGLAWALHELGRRPEQLRRAQRAADEGDDAYLTAVVKETLRRRPVVYQVARCLTEPLTVAGHRLPAGTTVMPAIGLVHGDPAHHERPEDFRPERFLGGPAPSPAWIPFGGGARRCPGAGFALLEATVVLREVLTRYDLRPDRARPEASRSRQVTHVPARGARIVVSRRGGGAAAGRRPS
ncbi:cytochrome P450 [Streptomyces caatingaensis]|uniref:Cytochrome P450 n=2 Tax=Streptomyces caatingaensis TaxID=1678637 RepID=A0A0K9XLM2_9ACTN|nr:cytochrome P450 [Streptomyces caatingaensis]